MGHPLQADTGELDFGDDLEAWSDRNGGDGRPSQLLPVRRHPETGAPTEGYIPHDAPTRPSIQAIHARAETLTQKAICALLREDYARCSVPRKKPRDVLRPYRAELMMRGRRRWTLIAGFLHLPTDLRTSAFVGEG
jgi:hypothetical protein